MNYKYFLLIILFCNILVAEEIPIQLEQARTRSELKWGLMNRKELPENYGMLFHFPRFERQTIWMFNVWVDLAVCFLDNRGWIREVHYLKAYPEKMDPKRPVLDLSDLKKYQWDEPVLRFFRRKQIRSRYPTRYVLELPEEFARKHRISVGDRLLWRRPDPVIVK